MAAPEKLVTSEQIDAKPEAPAVAPAPKAGDVVKKGVPPPEFAAARKDGMCTVRITKTGHGQVHTGNDDPNGKKTYDWQDEVLLPVAVGKALETRSFGEIVG